MAGSPKQPTSRGARRDRMVQEYRHDTYKLRGKLQDPTACPQCGAVFHKGRWTWEERPPHAHETLCPACRRIEDNCPAGYLTLRGSFLNDHKEELLGLARNEEALEKKEHPLARVIAFEHVEGGVVITTTDMHLARRIGEALHRAYEGEFSFHYTEKEHLLRGTWTR